LFAWRGAFGLIPFDLNGAYVSYEFPNFKIDENKAYGEFLELYFKQKWVWNEVEKNCTGTTKASRNRFKEKFFLDFEILLPPLYEQKCIITRIKSLASSVERVRSLMFEAAEDVEGIFGLTSLHLFSKVADIYESRPLGTLISMTSGKNLVSSQMDDMFPYPVYGGGGLIGRYHQYLVDDSTIAIGRVGARCGCVFVTEKKSWITDNTLYLTHISERLDRNYLVYALRNLDLRQQAKEAAQPVVSQERIKSQAISVPPLLIQHRIAAYLQSLEKKIGELKELHGKTEKEIEELLPSILDATFER
jgi:type I restriction enzyme S subunit